MKTNTRTRRPRRSNAALLSPLALALLVAGCDSNDDDNDGQLLDDTGGGVVIVAPPEANPFGVNVVVLNEEGQAIPQATVLVIDDAANGDIVPDDSEILITENGVLRIPLNSFDQIAVIRLEAESIDHFNNGGRYELTAGEDLQVEIVLTSEAANTSGISLMDASGDLSQGSLSATAMASNDPGQVMTSVTVPQDLEILDVDGNPLNDSLRLSVVHFDSRDENALAAFPGGFDVFIENVNDIDTPAIEGTIPSESLEQQADSNVIFQSAGFTAIEIFDSEGNRADTFVGEIDVTMVIPSGTLNPQTRQPIQVGDIIPVWSFDTDTASWVYEGREPVQADGQGGLQVTYQADHLSYWNLDFWTDASCNPAINVAVVSSDGQTVPDSPLNITILGTDANVGFRRSRTLNSGPVILARVPATFPVSVTFRSTVPGVSVSSITRNGAPYNGEGFDLCQGSAFSVATDQLLTDIVELSSFSYDVSAVTQCTNSPNTAPLPLENVFVTYYPNDFSSFAESRTNASGITQVGGQGNSVGTVNAFFNGMQQSQSVSQGSGNVNFTFPTQCVITTGASGL